MNGSDSLLLSSVSTAVCRVRCPVCLSDLTVLLLDLDRVLSRLSGLFFVVLSAMLGFEGRPTCDADTSILLVSVLASC